MARKKPLPKSEQELSGKNIKDRSKIFAEEIRIK